MKVTILYNGKYPNASASSNRVQNYAHGLRKNGATVTIASTFLVCKGYISKRLERFLTPLKIIPKVFPKRNQIDILFSYGHSWLTIVVIKICLLFSNTKLIIEVCEKPCSTNASWFYELYLIKTLNLIGTKYIAFKIVDGFVVISRALDEYVENLKAKSAKIIRIPILVDHSIYNDKAHSVINDIIRIKRPYILHSGLVTEQKDGIINVIKAFARVCKKRNGNLYFYFTLEAGPVDDLKMVKKILSDNDLEKNTRFLGKLEQSALIEIQRNSSMAIINKPLNEQNKYNFPTKLGEYLSLGVPVIATNVGEMDFYLKDGVNAFLLTDNTPQSIEKKITFILENPEQVKTVSINARKLANDEFDSIKNGKNLYTFFQGFSR